MKFNLVALAAILFASVPLSQTDAQVYVSANVMSMYDNNSFAFHDKRADVYHQLFLNLSKDFEGEYTNLSLYTYNAGVLFRTYNARTYSMHTIGGLYSIQLSHRDDGDEETDAGADTLAAEATGSDSTSSDESEDESIEEESSDEDSTSAVSGEDAEETSDETSAEPDTMKAVAPTPQPVEVVERTNEPAATVEEVFSDSLVTYLYLQPSGGSRFDRTEYLFYDFYRATINGVLRMHIAGPVTARTQYELEYKSYPHLIQFTHVEHNGIVTFNVRAHRAWEVYCSGDYGYKTYVESIADTSVVSGGGKGKGKGSVKPGKAIQSLTTPSAQQWVLAFGSIFTLSDASKLSLSYQRRSNPRSKARYVDIRQFTGGSEDEIFDDRYGYLGHEIDCAFEIKLPANIALTSALRYHWKTYQRAAGDLLGNPLPGEPQRHDQRAGIELQLTMPVFTPAGGTAIRAGVQYNYHRNMSNDLYHDYHIHQGAIVIEADF